MILRDIIEKATTELVFLSQSIYDNEVVNEYGSKCIYCHEEGKWYYQDEIPNEYMNLTVCAVGVRFNNNDDYGLSIIVKEHYKRLFK